MGVNWVDLGRAVALFAIIEGILPFVNPQGAKAALRKVADLEPTQLRIMGLAAMVIGCLILFSLRA
jgi:uncharacterized protein